MSRARVWKSSTGVWLYRVWSRGQQVGSGSADSEQEARSEAETVAAHHEQPEPFEVGEGIWGYDAPASGTREAAPEPEISPELFVWLEGDGDD